MNDNDNGYYSVSQSDPSEASAHYGASGGYTAPSPEPAPDRKQKRQRSGMRPAAVIALCLVCSILAAALGVGGSYLFLRGEDRGNALLDEPAVPQLPEGGADAAVTGASDGTQTYTGAGAAIYELAKKQVVGVTTEITYTNFFGQVSASSVSGTGFIISADGYILTNNHVIEDARKGGYDVSVLMYDGTEYTADIVGYDKENDVAVLKIDASGLTPVALGSDEDIVVGREIYPVGNPLGELNFTMTTGIISATDRVITTDANSVPISMFQIDAAVNSGNSGGPVYNAEGKVIGVVTAKTSATGVEGLGFAIPIQDAAHVANQILQHGYVADRATLGVSGKTVPASVAEQYGLAAGALIASIDPDSPAEEAGLQVNDIVTALDGKAVAGSTELTSMVRTYAVGDTVELTVWRNGTVLTLTATLGESQPPQEETVQQPSREEYMDMEDFFRQFFGGFGFGF